MGMAEKTEDIDKIYVVDPEFEAERKAKEEVERQARLNDPLIGKLPPVAPHTGQRTELLPGRPENSSYPGEKPPRPMPKGGVPKGDQD